MPRDNFAVGLCFYVLNNAFAVVAADTIDALCVAVGDFKGSVILVSHDEAFVSSVADEFWILDDEARRLRRFDGALADYKRLLLRAAGPK